MWTYFVQNSIRHDLILDRRFFLRQSRKRPLLFFFLFPLGSHQGVFLFGICLEGTKNGIVYIQNGVVILISNI